MKANDKTATPAAAAEPMEFTTGNPDLDHLLECTYWLNGAANMDSGIEWSEALEKVLAAIATPAAAAEPWKDYAEHLENCQSCAESGRLCDEGRSLREAARATK